MAVIRFEVEVKYCLLITLNLGGFARPVLFCSQYSMECMLFLQQDTIPLLLLVVMANSAVIIVHSYSVSTTAFYTSGYSLSLQANSIIPTQQEVIVLHYARACTWARSFFCSLACHQGAKMSVKVYLCSEDICNTLRSYCLTTATGQDPFAGPSVHIHTSQCICDVSL